MIARLNVGGPALHAVNLTAGLPERGFATRLLAGRVTEDEGDMEYYARDRGVELLRVPGLDRRLRPLALFRAFRFLYRTFRRDRPDVVHTHTAMAGAVGRLAAILAGVPVRVHTYHGHVLGGEYFSRWTTAVFLRVERFLARRTHALVALTDAQADEMSEKLGIAGRDRFAVIPLGLDLERFHLPEPVRALFREKVRGELGIPAGGQVIGIVGRLVPVKNHELLFEAFRTLTAGGSEHGSPEGASTPDGSASGAGVRGEGTSPGVETGDAVRAGPRDPYLVVVGGGEREAELRAKAAELGIAERIRWMGWRRELPEIYSALDVLALASRDEGTPVAVIEALAAGVPVVARAVGGVPRVLERGRWGRLVTAEDPLAFAEALVRCLEDPPALQQREAAAARTRARFGEDRLVREMSSLYRDLLSGEGVRY